MIVKELEIKGVKVIKISPIIDNRGYFSRNYDIKIARENGFHEDWVQENISYSKSKGTLRGLHYQYPPFCETKLVRVITGSVFDVFLDIRKNSPTFGKWGGYILNSDNPEWIYLPKGIAHGMITLEDNMIMQYKVDNFFEPKADSQINWNDPDLNIKWPINPKIVSNKDQKAPSFAEFCNVNGGLEV